MTTKHFIALADHIKAVNRIYSPEREPFDSRVVHHLADFLQIQYPLFKRERWLGYIKGLNGPRGGQV